MSEPVSSRELKRIYLQPRCNVDPHDGRVWCEDNVWPDDDCDEPGVEYIRADLLDEAIASTREECARVCESTIVSSSMDSFEARVRNELALAIRSLGGTDG